MDLTFGQALRRARVAASLSQQELADLSGLTVNGIGQLEREVRTRPYPHTVRALAAALGLDQDAEARFLAAVPSRRRATEPDPDAGVPTTFPRGTDLVGRTAESAQLDALLEAHRLVTVSGPGGVGKTALAVARRMGGRFPGGLTFVALAEVAEVPEALRNLARELGVVDTGVAALHDQVRAALEGPPRLVVLDNLEHLPGFDVDVARLVTGSPSVTVLATSRSPLRVRIEREYQLGPLSLPPGRSASSSGPSASSAPAVASSVPEASLAAVREVGGGALELLLTRAEPHTSRLSDDDTDALATICRRLDGLPLAIELAAAWLRVLTPRELADRLDEALPLLVDGPPDLPARHRTMRATIAWSEALLDPEHRTLFRRLAVLPATWSLATATAVTDRPALDVLHGVALLIDRSLVQRASEDRDGNARFRMLATVRAYGHERLEEHGHGDLDATRARHADVVSDFVRHAAVGLDQREQARWLDRVEDRLPDLRAALRRAVDTGAHDVAARLYVGLMWSWYLRHVTEGEVWGRAIVGLPPSDAPLRARVEATLALVTFARGDLAEALDLCQVALARAEAVNDPEGIVRALTVLANAAVASGDLYRAGWASARLRTVPSSVEVPFAAVARAVVTLAEARAALAAGAHDLADTLLATADREVEFAGAPWPRVLWLNIAIAADHLRGRHDRTLPLLRRSIDLSQQLGDDPALLHALSHLAIDLVLQDQPEAAARVFGAAEIHGDRTGQRITDPAVLELVGAHRRWADEVLGSGAFRRALAHGRSIGPDEALEQVPGST